MVNITYAIKILSPHPVPYLERVALKGFTHREKVSEFYA